MRNTKAKRLLSFKIESGCKKIAKEFENFNQQGNNSNVAIKWLCYEEDSLSGQRLSMDHSWRTAKMS